MGRFSLPEQKPDGLDSPVTALAMKFMARAQVKVFRLTGGRVGAKWRVGAGFRKPVPTLLLEHRGRKSGRLFTTPLLYLRSGDDLVIVGSQGGLPHHPQWYFNLLAHPDTRVHLKGRRDVPVTARVAGPDERAELWPRLVELYADFAKYQAWTDREIPVVVLSPRP
ncbi:nitroreductase family deazaflavin-dependent oxidoreductase [Amycolatopsis nalaikhensis]|uniref:Nitroreductase family deazaflavin-dependent oxidoreductase n=1 Tax=Amycolatopsis nalaikhensis TaxID=715472 RepID=A0ABY8XMC6_9PSEU|nr:nitroreductase family deazaflavin-dependent oxidoreductase [Amycolatopsis sp. 2-2]WIV56799.1 nitroreductase family deazaflavin-dependent oxidoreductase [Amycolatopsis sp. 2-2]